MTPEKIEELKAKYGELHVLEHQGNEVIVTAPNRPTWKRFRSQILDDRKHDIALEELVRACVVYPDRATFDALLDKKPGLVETFGKAVTELAGSGGNPEKKAL